MYLRWYGANLAIHLSEKSVKLKADPTPHGPGPMSRCAQIPVSLYKKTCSASCRSFDHCLTSLSLAFCLQLTVRYQYYPDLSMAMSESDRECSHTVPSLTIQRQLTVERYTDEVLVNPELFLEAARDLLRTALLEDFDRTIRASIQNALNKRGEARWYAPWMLIMFLHSPVQNSDGCRTEVVPYPQLPAKAFADIEDGQLVGNRQAGTDSDITIYNSTRIADIVLQVSVAEAIDGGATRA